jgi:hypothetical protein
MQKSLPFRQVHLDFHTSAAIPQVGWDFDAQEFTETLKGAHVNSVTVFAKCHHGYSYYPTAIGTPHPQLKPGLDLMGEMIRAAHQVGIRTPVYTTVMWDELAWATHPEWRVVFAGQPVTAMHVSNSPLKPGWKDLCLNTGYADYVVAQIEEILDRYEGDGFFVDIVQMRDCVCSQCMHDMQSMGIDPADPAQRAEFGPQATRRFMQRVSQAIHSKKPGQSIFFNNRTRMITPPELGARAEKEFFTHFELETLPAILWGYEHFPIYVRYFQTFDMQLVGMTSRFDTIWGDFGGYRNSAALEYECFQALAHGASCSIGDQLHPRGELDRDVYRLIGQVYSKVEQREPWCVCTQALPEIGVFTAATSANTASGIPDADKGSWRALEQLKHQFQFIDGSVDLSHFRLLILPDEIELKADLAEKLRDYLKSGGRLLISGRSGLDEARGDFWLAEEMGVHYIGPAPYTPDYIIPGEEIASFVDVERTVSMLKGLQVSPGPGTQVLARCGKPYFNRTWDHFCSHQYTPLEKVIDDPIILQKENVIYMARSLFSEYAQFSRRPHRQVIDACLRRLLPDPRVGKNNLPVTAVVTVRQQGQDLIVHLLNYVPQRRSSLLDVLEDVIPLRDVRVSIRSDRQPAAVRLVPEDQEIPWRLQDGYIHFTVPNLKGYQLVQMQEAWI